MLILVTQDEGRDKGRWTFRGGHGLYARPQMTAPFIHDLLIPFSATEDGSHHYCLAPPLPPPQPPPTTLPSSSSHNLRRLAPFSIGLEVVPGVMIFSLSPALSFEHGACWTPGDNDYGLPAAVRGHADIKVIAIPRRLAPKMGLGPSYLSSGWFGHGRTFAGSYTSCPGSQASISTSVCMIL